MADYDAEASNWASERKKFADKQSHEVAKKFDLGPIAAPVCKRTLKETHLAAKANKVYCVNWSEDGKKLVSSGQDNTLMVTDPVLGLKLIVPVKLSFGAGMSCAMQGMIAAVGGMDNTVTLYDTSTPADAKMKKQFTGHDGYISGIYFIDSTKMLTSSGDSFAKLWDTTTGQCVTTFEGHLADASGISAVPTAPKIFATSSTDKCTRIWDLGTGKTVRVWEAKYGANDVAMHPSGKGVMCGCDNASWEFFDIGSYSQAARGKVKKGRCEAVAFSGSGRYSVLGWDTAELVFADTYVPSEMQSIMPPSGKDCHTDVICSVAASPSGDAIATSSYDGNIKIWGAA